MHTDITQASATIHLDPIVKGGEAAALIEEVRSLLAKGQRRIHLDLRGVEHIDSAGLGMLVNAARLVRGAGADLDLMGAHDEVLSVLSRTGLLDVFDVAAEGEESGS